MRNRTTDSERVLVLNTDSMSIPVIPILSNYFREILVVDVRDLGKKYGFAKTIGKMKPSDRVNLFMDINCIRYRKFGQLDK